MAAYQSLSIGQFLFILLCGISVLDFGISWSQLSFDEEEEEPFILGFNELLFDEAEGYFWGTIQFWGYCMIIVAILQLLKALSVESL
jgi:hypothetical protein